jgi:Fe-S-cluster containining protein
MASGACMFYDSNSRLCLVYETRPAFCRYGFARRELNLSEAEYRRRYIAWCYEEQAKAGIPEDERIHDHSQSGQGQSSPRVKARKEVDQANKSQEGKGARTANQLFQA